MYNLKWVCHSKRPKIERSWTKSLKSYVVLVDFSKDFVSRDPSKCLSTLSTQSPPRGRERKSHLWFRNNLGSYSHHVNCHELMGKVTLLYVRT